MALKTPRLAPNATGDRRAYEAEAETQRKLGLPNELPSDWKDQALDRMKAQVKNNQALRVYLDACMRCGACTDKCHFFLGTGDPLNMPVARQDLYRKVYQRHFTFAGRWLPWLVGAKDLDEEMLERWFTYFHQCSQCRRCAVYCPAGIDTAEFAIAGREILNQIGQGQKFTNEIVVKAAELGNNLGLPGPALEDTLEGLEEELLETTGQPIRLPLDQSGADLLLVTPSADFFAEPHVDGLLGYAKVLHQAGLSWTFSSAASEAANFALFIGDAARRRALTDTIVESARALGVKRIVFGECGHAWRVAHNAFATEAELQFLSPTYRRPEHIVEVSHDLWQRQALRLDPAGNEDKRLTFHDSCNIARGARLGTRPGDQFRMPRALLRAACRHVYDMPNATIREQTFCCGAGGGLLTDELTALRVDGAKPRMDAFQSAVDTHAITHMVAICAICKSQLSAMMPHFGHEMTKILSLHQVVGDAVVFDRIG
ncbi:MAG: sulfate reduction electron transfer complex DsrMKJOP subunit DsrK [Pseudomonadota bacterium]